MELKVNYIVKDGFALVAFNHKIKKQYYARVANTIAKQLKVSYVVAKPDIKGDELVIEIPRAWLYSPKKEKSQSRI